MPILSNSTCTRTWISINGWPSSRKLMQTRAEAGNDSIAFRAWNAARSGAAARRAGAGTRAIGADKRRPGSADRMEHAAVTAAGPARAFARPMGPIAAVAATAILGQRATL